MIIQIALPVVVQARDLVRHEIYPMLVQGHLARGDRVRDHGLVEAPYHVVARPARDVRVHVVYVGPLLAVHAQRTVQLHVGAQDRLAPAVDACFVCAPLVVERLGRHAIVEVLGDVLVTRRSPHLVALGAAQEARRHGERVARDTQGRLVVLTASRNAGARLPVVALALALEHADGLLKALVLLDHVRSQDVVDVDALQHDEAVDGGLQGPLLTVRTEFMPKADGVAHEILGAAGEAHVRLTGRARLAPNFA
jgi:hypothetical protein